MLFPYKYINHNITQLQEWIDFLFINVWCEAKAEFNFELLNECPELKEIVENEAWKGVEDENTEKGKKRKKAIDHFTGPISVIYDIFKDELTPYERKKLQTWYIRNMRIDYILMNKKKYKAITKKDIAKMSKNLSEKLYSFYVNLYNNVLDLAVIRNQNGTLERHYQDFVKINNRGFCPFCGVEPIQSYEMKGHEAYDHYFPKENYPLFAINFKNLVPTCHKCNSKEKGRESPVLKKGKQYPIKALYPYTKNPPVINITVNVDTKNYKTYEHKHLRIGYNTNNAFKEVSKWWNMYGIETRYKDVLTNVGVGKYWLVEYLDEMSPELREKVMENLPIKLEKSKFKDKNFLKVPFLLACEKEGIL